MPTTEPMSISEVARILAKTDRTLDRIEQKLDSKSDKEEQNRKHAEQDEAIKSVEDRLDKFLFMILGAYVVAGFNLITKVVSG